MRTLLTTVLVLSMAAVGVAGPIQAPSPEKRARFGIWQNVGSQRVLQATRVIPLIPGTEFGWIIDLPDRGTDATRETVEWREELILASAPRYTADARRVAPNHLVRDRTSRVIDGAFDASWTLDAWDPPGPATIRVYVDDQLIASFAFELREVREQSIDPLAP